MRKKIALDTNLLILFVVGLADSKLISVHKRLRAYSISDFDLLSSMIAMSSGVMVTPNTLSEASNLLRQISGPAADAISSALKLMIENTSEIYVKSSIASARPEFLHLGLTDSVLLEINASDVVVITADLDLYLAAQSLTRNSC
jgi:hypothetical protein